MCHSHVSLQPTNHNRILSFISDGKPEALSDYVAGQIKP